MEPLDTLNDNSEIISESTGGAKCAVEIASLESAFFSSLFQEEEEYTLV